MIQSVIDGRIFGGMHYRFSGRHGALMGRKVSHWLTSHYFKRVEDEHEDEGEGAKLDPPEIFRGDSNADGEVDLSDAVYTLGYLFLAGSDAPVCLMALDSNADGAVDVSDALTTLNFLFLGGTPPDPILPLPIEADPDGLSCAPDGE